MEVTINLPEKIFANLSNVADKSRRRIDEIIVERIERDFAFDVADLEKQIAACSDKEVLEIAEIEMPPSQSEHLSCLLDKQKEESLNDAERKEMWQLMDASRLATLKKALALREISRRGLNGEN